MADIDAKESAINIAKSTTFEANLKTNSSVFNQIAYYYEGAYEEGAKNYKTKYASASKETPEMKAEQQKLNDYLDRMIDAYARAVKLAETDKNPNAANWKTRLTQIYKFRKQSETGLTEYINNIFNMPMPEIL
jgi:small-conductance mechanosensitive channel